MLKVQTSTANSGYIEKQPPWNWPETSSIQGKKQRTSNYFDAVAVDAAKVLLTTSKMDRELRLRQRRSQIAAASRKSRAKRKREHTVLKEENELLQTEVNKLKKRLREMNQEIQSESESLNNSMPEEVTRKRLDSEIERPVLQMLEEAVNEKKKASSKMPFAAKVETSDMQNVSSERLKELLHICTGDLPKHLSDNPILVDIVDFFEKSISEYFFSLKFDVLHHFGSSLCSAGKEEALANLQIRLHLGCKD